MPASYSLPATKMRTATKEVLIYSSVKYCFPLFEAIRKAAPLLSLKDYCNKFYPFLQISAVPFLLCPFPCLSGQSAMNGGSRDYFPAQAVLPAPFGQVSLTSWLHLKGRHPQVFSVSYCLQKAVLLKCAAVPAPL